eukprot:CAMPEP_0116139080 /NCGR_PEP_ID=MMETSP0329-20121206/13113_1 /TAXON_ID=697910 /ORGANISM="Pseudo-nitzschia arenysensis, Strain B593" /LENGTH=371 /DNA_ID=CAMNT_0003634083 /DNA_START=79 /DNA_END=1191 /DNA_ORIENTATION=+
MRRERSTNDSAIVGTLEYNSFWFFPALFPKKILLFPNCRIQIHRWKDWIDPGVPLFHTDGISDHSIFRGPLSTFRRILAGNPPQLHAATYVDSEICLLREHSRLDVVNASRSLGFLSVDPAPVNKLHDKTIFWGLVLVPCLAMIPSIVAMWGFGSEQYDGDTGLTQYALTSPNIWYALYTHPIIRFPDFLFGCLLSERFVRQWKSGALAQASSSTPLLADGATVLLITLTMAVPYTQRGSIYDTMMIQWPMILFGVLIYYGSFPPITNSCTGYLMSLPVSRWLGDFAFQVYLFRYPIFSALSWYEHGTLEFGNMFLSWPYFAVGCILLYGISYLWFVHVDTPFRKYLTQQVLSQQAVVPPPMQQMDDKPLR